MNLTEVGMVSDIGRETSPVNDLITTDAQLVHGEGNCGFRYAPLGQA
jgi:hypothetical protein